MPPLRKAALVRRVIGETIDHRSDESLLSVDMRQPVLDPAPGGITAELVRNRDDNRLQHPRSCPPSSGANRGKEIVGFAALRARPQLIAVGASAILTI